MYLLGGLCSSLGAGTGPSPPSPPTTPPPLTPVSLCPSGLWSDSHVPVKVIPHHQPKSLSRDFRSRDSTLAPGYSREPLESWCQTLAQSTQTRDNLQPTDFALSVPTHLSDPLLPPCFCSCPFPLPEISYLLFQDLSRSRDDAIWFLTVKVLLEDHCKH